MSYIGTLSLTAERSSPPVTLADIKSHVAATGYDEDDSLLTNYVNAAADLFQIQADYSVMPQTWLLEYSSSDYQGRLYLPRRPLTAVTAVSFLDDNSYTPPYTATDRMLRPK